jgi:nucleoside-diphosphate-sugar epimerase
MRVLVTGGAGYLGSALVPILLRRQHRVRVLDALMFGASALDAPSRDPNFELCYGDIRSRECVRAALVGIDAVIHLAALVGEPACTADPELTAAINHQATREVLNAACAASVPRFIFTSTCSNYGLQQELADENTPLCPLSLYAETKVRAEHEVLSRTDAPIQACVVRLATLFGIAPRMRFNLLINQFCRDAVVHRVVSLYGSDAWRPFIHVEDAAAALALLLEAPAAKVQAQVYNVGSENARKRDVTDLLERHAPGLRIEQAQQAPDHRDYRVSFEKFARALGFVPARSLAQGVEELCGAIRRGAFHDPLDPKYDRWLDAERLSVALAAAPELSRQGE